MFSMEEDLNWRELDDLTSNFVVQVREGGKSCLPRRHPWTD